VGAGFRGSIKSFWQTQLGVEALFLAFFLVPQTVHGYIRLKADPRVQSRVPAQCRFESIGSDILLLDAELILRSCSTSKTVHRKSRKALQVNCVMKHQQK
jgi:hypothetical protein